MSDTREVWKYCSLKDSFRSIFLKILQGRDFVDSRHFFWEQPSKYCNVEYTAIFVCLLNWSRWYSVKWSSNLGGPEYQHKLTPIPQFFKYYKPSPKYLIHWTFKMSAIFVLKKNHRKSANFSCFYEVVIP